MMKQWASHIGSHIEFTQHAVNKDFQMKFTHAEISVWLVFSSTLTLKVDLLQIDFNALASLS